jgi:predicted GTPase
LEDFDAFDIFFFLLIVLVNFSLIRRREALVYNTPEDRVTRDIREGAVKLGDLRFSVLDSVGLEMEASSGSILDRTSRMTTNVLARSQITVFLIALLHNGTNSIVGMFMICLLCL